MIEYCLRERIQDCGLGKALVWKRDVPCASMLKVWYLSCQTISIKDPARDI